jgi:NhaA family Na+:H+ antiporter
MLKLHRVIRPIEQFLKYEAASGILLMIAAAVAFYMANSSFTDTYFNLVNLPVSFAAGSASITHTLVYWINDAVMVLFFFVVGLEIKKELIEGQLNSPSKAAFPAIAATGGAIVPAIIYAFFNYRHPDFSHGWGIPMATDIAFAVGVLALFGKRVPVSLKIFLLALAIVDDLIAVLVIAIFYTDTLNFLALGGAFLLFFLTRAFKASDVKNYVVYFIVGIFAWGAMFASGVHATIAGVILGLMTPLTLPDSDIRPADDLVHFFHPWVAFVIMPIFAFFNAGVKLDFSQVGAAITHPITMGVAIGLIAGKPIGIYFSTLLAKKLKLISIPSDVSMTKILAVGFLGGIGFTMALFVAGLSFKNPELGDYAKVGILLASMVSALVGGLIIYLAVCLKSQPR